jgi:hypothetical protein
MQGQGGKVLRNTKNMQLVKKLKTCIKKETWVSKLVARVYLLRKLSGFQSRHLSKIQNR